MLPFLQLAQQLQLLDLQEQSGGALPREALAHYRRAVELGFYGARRSVASSSVEKTNYLRSKRVVILLSLCPPFSDRNPTLLLNVGLLYAGLGEGAAVAAFDQLLDRDDRDDLDACRRAEALTHR